ncbi:MAG: sigma-70 family RNA polymerase sigma factor [bacterium]|nr:sigma-70 family RNA polymerase sigma factor [bacterium]
MNDPTQLFQAISDGDPRAAEQLLPLVYQELRKLAAAKLSQEKSGQTLQATALVHEAYLRLVGNQDGQWDSRGHFFAAAAEAMRRILIDNARRKKAEKHGGQLQRQELADVAISCDQSPEELLALDEALVKLEVNHPRKAKLVKLRYFAGLTLPQAASALEISLSTAEKDWTYAKCWLRTETRKHVES